MAKDKKDKGAPDPDAVEGEEPAEGKKKPPLKLILIAAGAAVLVLGGGGTGAFLLLGNKNKAPAAGGEHADAKPKKKEEKGHGKEEAKGGKEGAKDGKGTITEGPDGVVFYTMPDMVVNIQTADSRPTFLKLKLAFELQDADVADALEPNAPRLADMFQTFLRELRPEDLTGSQGSYQLRMEILRRVNLVIAPKKVNAVLIQEMLIQ